MVLVTGPTGSGKTTTLYAALQRRDASTEKIITVEDPIEYQLPGITQMPVHRQAGVTFASALRAILRQDPDVVMIGEMRDQETAEIAVQAAMTGHLVFSTLHTNDAISAIPRLLDLGIPDYLSRRRSRACSRSGSCAAYAPDCRESYEPSPETRRGDRGPAGRPHHAHARRRLSGVPRHRLSRTRRRLRAAVDHRRLPRRHRVRARRARELRALAARGGLDSAARRRVGSKVQTRVSPRRGGDSCRSGLDADPALRSG